MERVTCQARTTRMMSMRRTTMFGMGERDENEHMVVNVVDNGGEEEDEDEDEDDDDDGEGYDGDIDATDDDER